MAIKRKNLKPKKKLRGYSEDFPTDPGMTLDKLPERIPKKKKTSIPGMHGSGTREGPAQELPKLLRRKLK